VCRAAGVARRSDGLRDGRRDIARCASEYAGVSRVDGNASGLDRRSQDVLPVVGVGSDPDAERDTNSSRDVSSGDHRDCHEEPIAVGNDWQSGRASRVGFDPGLGHRA